MKNTPNIFQHADLDGSSFTWAGNSTGVLLIHGFTATTVEVKQMASFLHKQGFTVSGPLLPGHGKTIELMNQVEWNEWIQQAEQYYLELKNQCKSIFVLGESMGGLISLALAIKHPEIKGAMIFAPALKVPGLEIAEFIWPFKKYVFKKNVDETMDWQGFNVVPLHAAFQLLKLQRYIKRNLPKMRIPTLIFQGRLDKSIDPLSSVDVLVKISSSEKELIWLEDSTHCILLDKQLEEVEDICLNFIKVHK